MRSAGLLVYRRGSEGLEVLLAHMGGPYWARRDAGAWTIPKGEHGPDEDPLQAARREFVEELGIPAPSGPFTELGEVRQAGGKVVTAWAIEGDLDPAEITPGTFEMEWPRGSGRTRTFPEIDRVAWFAPDAATERIVSAQRVLLTRLRGLLAADEPSGA